MNSHRQNAIAVVEHDLTVLDYLSDSVQLFYGEPHEFGVVTTLKTTKNGINAYLDGYLKAKNIEFREMPIGFKKSVSDRDWSNNIEHFNFFNTKNRIEGILSGNSGRKIYQSEILGVVGENGCGKVRSQNINQEIKPDEGFPYMIDKELEISYKPQYITKVMQGTGKEFVMEYSQNYDFSEATMNDIRTPRWTGF